MEGVLVAAPQISGDVESGIALAILSRPIGRSEYVAGKWLGLASLVVIYAGGAAAIELGVVNAVVGYVPPEPLSFIAFVIAEGLAIMTFALLLSTRLSGMVGGVIALVSFGIAWIGGVRRGSGAGGEWVVGGAGGGVRFGALRGGLGRACLRARGLFVPRRRTGSGPDR